MPAGRSTRTFSLPFPAKQACEGLSCPFPLQMSLLLLMQNPGSLRCALNSWALVKSCHRVFLLARVGGASEPHCLNPQHADGVAEGMRQMKD